VRGYLGVTVAPIAAVDEGGGRRTMKKGQVSSDLALCFFSMVGDVGFSW